MLKCPAIELSAVFDHGLAPGAMAGDTTTQEWGLHIYIRISGMKY